MKTDILPELGWFHWRQVYGFGLTFETYGVDRYIPKPWATRRECNVKILIICALFTFSFPVSRWKEYPPELL